jgi:predicted DNA-binding protein
MIESQEQIILQENTDLTLNIERKENISFGSSKSQSKNIISKLKDLDQ